MVTYIRALFALPGFLVLAFVLIGTGTPSSAYARQSRPEIILYTARNLVSVNPDGTFTPAMIDWARLVGEASETSLTLRELDFGRSFPLVQSRSDSCSVGIIRTAEREPLVDWIVPLTADEIILAARPDDPVSSPVDLATLEQTTQGSIAASHGVMSEVLQKRGVSYRRVPDHAGALRLLETRHVRFAVTSRSNLHATARSFREVARFGPLVSWMICGLKMPADLRARLRDEQIRMAKDGRLTPVLRAFSAPGVEPPLH